MLVDISQPGFRIAVLDAENQRIAVSLSAVNQNIMKIMVEQIAPLLDKRELLERRKSLLTGELQTLFSQIQSR